MATLLNGKKLSDGLRAQIGEVVRATGVVPGLATVLVGDDPASQSYVRSKKKACEKAGFNAVDVRLPADTPEDELIREIAGLNARNDIHGILVQQPLPGHINTETVVAAVDADKDVDGFHPVNLGRLMRGHKCFAPCTPFGITVMLASAGVEVSGQSVVIAGRSLLVGKPLAMLLLARAGRGTAGAADATVTVCHSRTRDLAAVTRSADILVCAIGRPGFFTADMVGEGATVIDVGINRVDDPAAKKGYRIVGDVDFEQVEPVAGVITPVPGGVGPMTVTMLLYNTLQAARGLYSQDPLEAQA